MELLQFEGGPVDDCSELELLCVPHLNVAVAGAEDASEEHCLLVLEGGRFGLR